MWCHVMSCRVMLRYDMPYCDVQCCDVHGFCDLCNTFDACHVWYVWIVCLACLCCTLVLLIMYKCVFRMFFRMSCV